MPSSLYLSLGDYFAESTLSQNGELRHRRWAARAEGLEKSLTQLIQDFQPEALGRVVVETRRAQGLIERKLGSNPAVLYTSGFENWLDLNLPLSTPHFTTRPERVDPCWDANLCFGLSERSLPSGEVLRPVDSNELEFMAAKLKMNKVENIVLCFLHSIKNPQNEIVAEKYLQEQGFRVFRSSLISQSPVEIPRWLTSILSAYCYPELAEVEKKISAALAAANVGFTGKVEFLGCNGKTFCIDEHWRVLESLAAAPWILRRAAQSLTPEANSVIYMGLERFIETGPPHASIPSRLGPLSLGNTGFEFTPIQPTAQLVNGFWGATVVSQDELGFEPGPMCLGKGQKPTLLDLMFLKGHLADVEGLKDRLVEKTRPRVLEALKSLGRHGDLSLHADDLVELIFARAGRVIEDLHLEQGLWIGPLAKALTSMASDQGDYLSGLVAQQMESL